MIKNIDMKCADYGRQIVDEIAQKEKSVILSTIIKATGVLQEDGLYAFALYVKSESGDISKKEKTAKNIYNKSFALLKDLDIAFLPSSEIDFLDSIKSQLGNDLNKLLFAREIVERTLIYAKYHAQALEEKE